MEKKEHDKIIAFDTLFTTNHIQMLKIVMPCLDHPMQKKLAVYIKYLELKYTLDYYSSHPFELCSCSVTKEELNIGRLCSELLPFCTAEEKQKLEQIAGLFRSMEMYQEMSKTMELMKDIFPEGFGDMLSSASPLSDNSGNSLENSANGMMDMLMNLLSPEQKNIFELFGGINDTK